MTEQRQRVGVFSALKQVLKTRDMRYRDLADLLGASEQTIKRLFKEQDCKMSRLIEICNAIGIDFSDLIELAANAPAEPTQLSLQTEHALASNTGLMSFFMLLVSGFDTQAIAHYNKLKGSDAYLYLRELEKLGLIRLGANDVVHFLIKRPIRWRLDGPLHKLLVRVNQGFVAQALTGHNDGNYPFYSSSRLFSDSSIKQLNDETDRLYRRFQQQASLDQMFFSAQELKPFKLVATIAPFEVREYFNVPAFNDAPTETNKDSMPGGVSATKAQLQQV